MKITISLQGLDQIGQELDKEIRQFQTFLLSEFQRQVVPRTPIDRGRARAGWQQRQLGATPTVENRVPYIERLEGGYSRQAPKGFTNQAIQATIRASKRIIKK